MEESGKFDQNILHSIFKGLIQVFLNSESERNGLETKRERGRNKGETGSYA